MRIGELGLNDKEKQLIKDVEKLKQENMTMGNHIKELKKQSLWMMAEFAQLAKKGSDKQLIITGLQGYYEKREKMAATLTL